MEALIALKPRARIGFFTLWNVSLGTAYLVGGPEVFGAAFYLALCLIGAASLYVRFSRDAQSALYGAVCSANLAKIRRGLLRIGIGSLSALIILIGALVFEKAVR